MHKGNKIIEAALQPLTGETFPHRSTNTDDGARLIVKAQNFWDSSMSSAFFDVRVFNSHAPSICKTSTAACYRRHELEKRAYERRIIEVEHGSFIYSNRFVNKWWMQPVGYCCFQEACWPSINQALSAIQYNPGIYVVQDCLLTDQIHNHVPPRSQIFIPQSHPQHNW